MIVTLKPGETLQVDFEEADGGFEIAFDTAKHPMAVVVEARMPDSAGRAGEVYRENFGEPIVLDLEVVRSRRTKKARKKRKRV